MLDSRACLFALRDLPLLSSGLDEVVLVIQSQRNSYHARQSVQRRAELLQQAAQHGQVTPGSLVRTVGAQRSYGFTS